ncbi:MAG: hypothetical protein IPJ18_20485 [Betaproteobacteria bacterium]|nr:hypothetical protein [Betaproteobacteria bacterium]
MEPLLPAFARYNIAFERNASGLRKTTLDPIAGREVHGTWSYPSLSLIPLLIHAGATFTIGSDAHTPEDVGVGVREVVHALIPLGLKTVSYFEGRQRVDIEATSLMTSSPSQQRFAKNEPGSILNIESTHGQAFADTKAHELDGNLPQPG